MDASAILGLDAYVDAGAYVGRHARIGDYAGVGANSVIADGATILSGANALNGVLIGEGVILGRAAVVGAGATLGDGVIVGRKGIIADSADLGANAAVGYTSRVGTQATVGDNTMLGNFVLIGPGAVVEASAVARNAVVRGDVGIGSVIGPDSKVDAGATVGEDVRLRKRVIVASEAVIADDVTIGRDVSVGRKASIDTGLRVAANAVLGSGSVSSAPVVRDQTVDAVSVSGRGVWHWRRSSDPAGTLQVVGNGTQEAAARAEFSALDITHHYGDYVSRPVSEPAVIGAWVASLHTAGSTATVLLGDPLWIDPNEHAFMLGLIDQRLLNYNAARPSNEQFDGIHLDIEPQADATWASATAEDKRLRVLALYESLRVVREHLDNNGGSGLTIFADLPVWFDNLPPALGGTGTIGWESEAERVAWYATLPVDGISMMAYQRSSLGSIVGGVETEDRLFRGELRVGIEQDGYTFADNTAFFGMADQLEAAGYVVDLHAYSDFSAL